MLHLICFSKKIENFPDEEYSFLKKDLSLLSTFCMKTSLCRLRRPKDSNHWMDKCAKMNQKGRRLNQNRPKFSHDKIHQFFHIPGRLNEQTLIEVR